jgi:hypothetical protein
VSHQLRGILALITQRCQGLLVIVYRIDSLLLLLRMLIQLGHLLPRPEADIVLLYARFELFLYILLMPLHKLLPNLFPICQMPILLEFFNSLFLYDLLEYILASRLIINQCLLLNKLLNPGGRCLIDAVAVPQLLIWLL